MQTGKIIQLFKKIFSYIENVNPQVKAAVIGGIFLVIITFFNVAGVFSSLAQILSTRNVTVYLDGDKSGTALQNSNEFRTYAVAKLHVNLGA